MNPRTLRVTFVLMDTCRRDGSNQLVPAANSRPPLVAPILRQVRVQIREVRTDLRSDGQNRRDAGDRDDTNEQAVLDQVLALVVPHETRKQSFHGGVSFEREFY